MPAMARSARRWGYDANDGPYGCVAADFDGDGWLDLAILNWRSDDLYLF